MDNCQAIFVIFLLTWAAVSVSGTTPELSKTTGDTVNIPCVFGEGTLRNIYWYYNDGTGPQKILFLSNGVLAIDQEYADRASLQNDNLTLILKDITVYDEGTYRCDVDRQGQTSVPNINAKLNVFSLRSDTLPVIYPCSGTDESSSCNIHANKSITLTCKLPNVYPVEDTKLIWYQDGKSVPSTPDVTQNDDGTTNISRHIQVSETRNLTCNATYLSANGSEKTAVSAEAWIIPPADVPYIPGKKMTTGQIVGMTIGIVLLVSISLAFIAFFITRQKCSKAPRSTGQTPSEEKSPSSTQRSGDGYHPIPQKINSDSKQDQAEPSKPVERPTEKRSKNEEVSAGSSKLTERAAANGSQSEAAEYSKPTDGKAENRPTNKEVDSSTLTPSATVTQGGNVNSSDERKISDEEIMKLSTQISCDNYTALCVALGYDIAPSNNIVTKRQLNYSAALVEMLQKWKTKTGGFIHDLDKALVEADLGGLRYEYKM